MTTQARIAWLLTVVAVLMQAPALAQESAESPLTNADVLKMVEAGFADGVIIHAIRSKVTAFDLSTDALVELKTAGVSDVVVAVMLLGDPEEDPGTASVTIKDGTDLVLQLVAPLSSATAKVDDPVELAVAEEIVVDGKTAVRVGAPARGRLTLVRSRKNFARPGKLNFSIDWVEAVDGKRVPLRYSKKVRGDEKFGKAVAILAFFVKGKELEIPAGTEYTLYIDGEHEVEVPVDPSVMP